MTSGSNTAASRLFSRPRELERLTSGLDAAMAGRGHLYLVSGMPGVGKTRLLDEIGAVAAQREILVLKPARDANPALGLTSWASLLAGLLDHPLAMKIDKDLRAQIVRLIPGHGDSEVDKAPAEIADPAYARFVLIDSMTSFLHALGRTQTIVLIIDDLHTASLPSLLALELLARDLSNTHLLVVGAYRDCNAARAGHFATRLGNLARYSTALALADLDFAGTRALIADRLGQEPSLPLVSLLHEATGGNPLFLDEMMRQLPHDLAARGGSLRVPQGVCDAVRAWRDALPAETQLILETASVIGRIFDADLVAITHDIGTHEVLAALAPATTAGLVQQTAGGAFRFRHGVTRDTIYAELTVDRRRVLHDAVGLALELRHAGRFDRVLPALARHFSEGQLDANRTRARTYLSLAGEQSLARSAYDEAISYFERALALVDPVENVIAREVTEIRLLLAQAAFRAGDIVRGNQAAYAAVSEARRAGAVLRMAHAALIVRRDDTPRADTKRLAVLAEARSALNSRNAPLAVCLDAHLAREIALSGDWQRADVMSRWSLSTARELGDERALSTALAQRCKILGSTSHQEERLALSAELLDRALRSGDRERAMGARFARVADLLALGDPAIDAEIRAASRIGDHTRQPHHRWWALLWRAMRANLVGDLRRAKRLSAEAHAIGSHVRPRTARIALSVQTILRLWQQGDPTRLLVLVESFAAEHGGTYPEASAGRVWALAQGERRGDAARVLSSIGAETVGGEPVIPDGVLVAALLAETCAFLGDVTLVAPLWQRLRPYSGSIVVVGPGIECLGPADRYLGLLATLRHQWAEAEKHYSRSLEISRRLAALPFIARTLLNHGTMLAARGGREDSARAHEMLTEARQLADRCGLAAVTRAVDQTRQSLPAPPSVTALQTLTGSLVLASGYWTFNYGGRTSRIRDRVGMQYLAALLEHPHRATSAAQLARLAGRAQRLDETPSSHEARVRVTRALREAIRRIAVADAPLGKHLDRSLRTGTRCCYAPGDGSTWTVVRE